jgi:predicted nucleotidyltransferase
MISSALTSEEARRRITEIRGDVLRLGVSRLALFGSVARNTARLDSDVDVLVEFGAGQKTYDHFLDLADLLERALGRRVELVTPESLSPFLKPHILADATDVVRAA